MNGDLEPCPFCGGEAKIETDFEIEPVLDENGAYIDADISGGNTAWVTCKNCGASTKEYTVSEGDFDWCEEAANQAIKAWNGRIENDHRPGNEHRTSIGYISRYQ